jgi:hypothetical protein
MLGATPNEGKTRAFADLVSLLVKSKTTQFLKPLALVVQAEVRSPGYVVAACESVGHWSLASLLSSPALSWVRC